MGYRPAHRARKRSGRLSRPSARSRILYAGIGILTLGGLTGLPALAASAAPASFTWQDDSLQATPPEFSNYLQLDQPTGTGPYAVPTSCHGFGFGPGAMLNVTAPGTGWVTASTITCGSPFTVTVPPGTTQGMYDVSVSGSPSPDHGATESARIVVTVNASGNVTQVADYSVTFTGLPDTLYASGIRFTALETVNCRYTDVSLAPCGTVSPVTDTSLSFTGDNLPGGLGFTGNTLTPGTAVPGTYNYATVAAAENGASASDTFTLDVTGHKVFTVTPGNLGDQVNVFGNGFDVFQQHWAGNAPIAGWTATKGDPATHFVREPGADGNSSHLRFEAVNGKGIATGLCVSMPGWDAAGTGVPTGLVLRGCNTGPWQEFTQSSAGIVTDVATGLIVNPDGTGAQLRGETTASPWGGSVYTWTDYAHLAG